MFSSARSIALISCCILLFGASADALVFTDPKKLPKRKYDFVIVGAGTAGNVMANRLTENGQFSVLVIEAGVSNDGVLASAVPFLAPTSQPASPILWNYTTVPQKALNNRVLGYSRGRLLGGSSSVNFMTYTRGSDDDYNRWAKLIEDPTWSWKNLEPYYLKSSRLVPPADHHNTNGQVNPAVHGNGPVELSVPGFPTDIDARVINSSRELSSQFPFNLDVQSGNTIGINHPILSNYFVVDSTTTFDTVLRNPTLINNLLQEWNTTGKGLFVDAPANTLGFLRVNQTVLRGATDPSAGSKSGHFEMIFADGFAATVETAPATGNFITVNTAVVSPSSKGSITLASADPFAFPNIDPGFFTSSLDVSIMIAAVRAVRQFLTASPWKGYITGRFGVMGAANTDAELTAASRESVVTIWHPTSTAMMSPATASWGVVDTRLLVKGAVGLRIVDASVFPVIPAGHTAGPVYIVAERAADFVLEAWC
ncbi:GMC oxidoreductase [Sphaerobolus stellatus SS14]|uniref:GMC oxidoreductase n=1 Tax=Sphaerobolus stellatus (strain SS14) TaxID=990650 RepID=A0A0C9V4E8_SPHS4|nr:GMC oxidoreductase [Sphaerobolus stellatus SS14]